MKKITFLLALPLYMLLSTSCNTHNPESTVMIPHANLDEHVVLLLDEIFSKSNPKLYSDHVQNCSLSTDKPIFIIKSESELESICPDNIEIPIFDFSNNCIIYSHIQTPSVSDEILYTELAFQENSNLHYFIVSIQKCTDCWDAIGECFPYGIFSVNPTEIRNAELKLNVTE